MNVHEYAWPEGEQLIYVRPPKEEYKGKLDHFYSPALFPELALLKENWQLIRDEIIAYEKKNGFLQRQDSMSPAEVYGGNWTLIYLKSFLREFPKNRAEFPVTSKIIDSIPNIVFAGISVLPGNTVIAPHYGDTNGIVRGHLGLIIPAPHPIITLRVGDEERGWEEGELLCFVNVQKHEVWNKSNERRYVLMFDFVPEILQHRTLEICSKGLGSQSFIFFYKKSALVRMLPDFIHELMVKTFSAIWSIYLRFQNLFKKSNK